MRLKITFFLSLFLTALTLGAALAHLFELPNKMALSRDEYLTVQQIYSGWALLGIVVIGALIAILVLAFMVRRIPKVRSLVQIAFACLIGAQIVFWTFTYPTNQVTGNWTFLPDNWMQLRRQWEYSHAGGAILDLIAMTMLILSLLVRREPLEERIPDVAPPASSATEVRPLHPPAR